MFFSQLFPYMLFNTGQNSPAVDKPTEIKQKLQSESTKFCNITLISSRFCWDTFFNRILYTQARPTLTRQLTDRLQLHKAIVVNVSTRFMYVLPIR